MGGALAGVTVLVPRTSGQAGGLARRIAELGGEPLEAPTIEIRSGDSAGLAAALREVADGRFVAVCLTSPNGVVAVADALAGLGLDRDVFAGVTVAVVGPGTARTIGELLDRPPDLVPDTATTAALAEALPAGSGRVLLPRADIATSELPDGLRARGYDPVEVDAYRTVRPDGLPGGVLRRLAVGEVDLLAFTSSSTVRNFVALTEGSRWSGAVVSIGPVTSAAARELGLEVAAEATCHDLDGLVDALVAAAARSPR